jgi:flavoprotein hydroxylase
VNGADFDADVALVGFGPVGSALSILLAQQGISVVALERWPERYPLPRAVHMDQEVTRIFQACGLGRELAELSEPADIYEWRNRDGVPLLRLGRSGFGSCGWPHSSMFNQPEIEAALERRAREVGVDVRRGAEVTGLDQDQSGVTLHVAAGTPIRARYVVGCDGANSTVRGLAGIEVHDLGFYFDWLVVDVILDEPRIFDPINLQICDPARPTTAVSGGPGRRRWEFMRLPHETVESLSSQARAWELLEAWDVRPDNADLERHAVYTFNARYAETWRKGRVLLAGDAAHQMPPFAGQGMCSGIRDAANLAWKLALVVTGSSPDGLLDTYETERRPEVAASIDFSVELGKVICVPDPAEAAARDEAMAAGVGPEPSDVPPLPPITAGVIDGTDGPAGHVFPQGNVDGVRFDDVHGVGWRLISVDPSSELDPWLASIGGRSILVSSDDAVYGPWFATHGCVAVLHRPDFHIYGIAATPAEIAGLQSRLRSRLSLTGATV